MEQIDDHLRRSPDAAKQHQAGQEGFFVVLGQRPDAVGRPKASQAGPRDDVEQENPERDKDEGQGREHTAILGA